MYELTALKIRKKNWTELNEQDELKIKKHLSRHPDMLTNMLSYICMLNNISKHLFVYPIQNKKQDWAKWAKWARILKNTHTDEQLCSWICFIAFACSNMYQNIH